MTGALIDMFPPEVQTIYAASAGTAAVLGLFVWGAGIKIARISVAVLLGASLAGFAAWGLPGPTGISPVTAAIIGFVIGVLAGAVTFRFLQGMLLALCVALAATGIYYRAQVIRPGLAGGGAGGAPVATLSAQDMLISPERLALAPSVSPAKTESVAIAATLRQVAGNVSRTASHHWLAIPAFHRQCMTILAILTAIVGLVVALFFPRYTTWMMTAALGTVMVVVALYALLEVYAPQYKFMIPSANLPRYGILAIIMLVGMLMQRTLFWPSRKPRPAPAQTSAAVS